MTLRRFIVIVGLLVAMGLTLVWQRSLSVRYGYDLIEVTAHRERVQSDNGRLYCQVQSMVGAGELMAQVAENDLPLVGWHAGEPSATNVAMRD